MTIESIPEDLRAFVSSELGSGRYCSLEELLAEALRLLHEHETFLAAHRGDLPVGSPAQPGIVIDPVLGQKTQLVRTMLHHSATKE